MTAEQRIVIGTEDIMGFEFECPECNGRFYIPIDKYQDIKAACPNCRATWFTPVNGADHVFVNDLLRNLRQFCITEHPPVVKIRFQLGSDPK